MSCTEVSDEPLPDRLNLDHLKKQAKQLIRLYRSRDRGGDGAVSQRAAGNGGPQR